MSQAGLVLNQKTASTTNLKFSSGGTGDVLSLPIMAKRLATLFWILVGLAGCSTVNYTPGATLLSGLTLYQGEMQRLGGSAARWPERQRAGGTLKMTITATVGASPEFYRLVDLDIRRREFTITMRETSLRPDRIQEMKDELGQMNDEIAALKSVVRTQLAALRVPTDPDRRIEETATRGLISLALDNFSGSAGGRAFEARSAKVGPYVVTDLGEFSTVRAPDGQTFRCALFGMPEEGAGMRCEPAK